MAGSNGCTYFKLIGKKSVFGCHKCNSEFKTSEEAWKCFNSHSLINRILRWF